MAVTLADLMDWSLKDSGKHIYWQMNLLPMIACMAGDKQLATVS
ncbi:hypothetical protein [Thiothrix unzii]|jgi:hypothetical protein|nr:hypothetical protein [Thiothrix unzii]MDX9990307.1 hypothetical protein [Thiothrix unzii]